MVQLRQKHRSDGGRHSITLTSTTLLSIFTILLAMTSLTSAHEMRNEARARESEQFRKLARQGRIHFDRRDPPVPLAAHLQPRETPTSSQSIETTTIVSSPQSPPPTSSTATEQSPNTTIISSTSAAATVAVSSSPSSLSNSTATTTSASATSPSVTVITTPLPSPFDTSLGNNFTSNSCPNFFSTFLSNSTFRSCLPVSLLLQNSNSFFRAERSASLLTSTLDASCSASLAICAPMLTNLASELISNANCGQDYRDQNPLVQQAYNGLLAYEPVYRATCLKNSDSESSSSSSSSSYCFVDAVTNSTNPADIYPYFTALGLNLPASAQPSCTPCLRQTMKLFAGYAVRKEQPLAATYLACANQIDRGCGASFANASVAVGSVNDGIGKASAAVPTISTASSAMLLLSGAVGLWLAVLA